MFVILHRFSREKKRFFLVKKTHGEVGEWLKPTVC